MNEIVIYEDGNVELPVSFDEENFWLRQNEISDLFGKDRTVITRHINKILNDKEVDEKSNVQKMHIANFKTVVNGERNILNASKETIQMETKQLNHSVTRIKLDSTIMLQ